MRHIRHEWVEPGCHCTQSLSQMSVETCRNKLMTQGQLERYAEPVQQMLDSAATGAAKLVARKLLDTLKREAVAFEDKQRADHAPAPSPLMSADLEEI